MYEKIVSWEETDKYPAGSVGFTEDGEVWLTLFGKREGRSVVEIERIAYEKAGD